MKPRVLIVDDDEYILDILQRILSKDFDVTVFLSPFDALKYLTENDCPVIITDFRMPGLNGYEFVLRATELCPNAVSILITGHMDLVPRDFTCRFFEILEKPFALQDIRNIISAAMEEYLTT